MQAAKISTCELGSSWLSQARRLRKLHLVFLLAVCDFLSEAAANIGCKERELRHKFIISRSFFRIGAASCLNKVTVDDSCSSRSESSSVPAWTAQKLRSTTPSTLCNKKSIIFYSCEPGSWTKALNAFESDSHLAGCHAGYSVEVGVAQIKQLSQRIHSLAERLGAFHVHNLTPQFGRFDCDQAEMCELG